MPLQFKRFGYDMQTGTPTKLSTLVKYSHKLELSAGNGKGAKVPYSLFGGAFMSGVNSGYS